MIQLNKKKRNKDGNNVFSALGTASTMGMHFISGPFVGGGLGYLCDIYLFNSYPIGSLIGIVLGVAAGFRNVFLDAELLRKKQEQLDNNLKNEQETKKHND